MNTKRTNKVGLSAKDLRDVKAHNSLRGGLRKLAGMAGLASIGLGVYNLSAYKICVSSCSEQATSILLVFGQMAAIAIFATLFFRIFRLQRSLLLTPLAGVFLCLAAFMGFGGLSTTLIDDTTAAYVARGTYPIDAIGNLRTNILTFLGAGSLFLTMSLAIAKREKYTVPKLEWPLAAAALLFVYSGLALKYSLIIPAQWGYLPFTVPGVLQSLAFLPDLGFMLLALASTKGDKRARFLFPWLWGLHFVLCLLEFSKESIVLAMLTPAIGIILGGGRPLRAIIWIILAISAFSWLQNPMLSARKGVIQYESIHGLAPVSVRASLLAEGLGKIAGDSEIIVDKQALPPQLWWVRLNYAGPQLRAMELYDSGRAMNWMNSPLAYVVPRFLWPGKPNFVNVGLFFNREVSGNRETTGRVAVTVFAEGYWWGGWMGCILFGALTGLMLAWVTNISVSALISGNVIYFPFVLLALKLGAFDILGFLQTSVVGGFIILVGIYFATSFARRIIHVHKRPRVVSARSIGSAISTVK